MPSQWGHQPATAISLSRTYRAAYRASNLLILNLSRFSRFSRRVKLKIDGQVK
jgi:hypothetical protein